MSDEDQLNWIVALFGTCAVVLLLGAFAPASPTQPGLSTMADGSGCAENTDTGTTCHLVVNTDTAHYDEYDHIQVMTTTESVTIDAARDVHVIDRPTQFRTTVSDDAQVSVTVSGVDVDSTTTPTTHDVTTLFTGDLGENGLKNVENTPRDTGPNTTSRVLMFVGAIFFSLIVWAEVDDE